MKLEIEVKRIRSSVTQGAAAVYVNGEKVIQFVDKIEIIKEGQPYYGEKIGGWASVKPDADFIKGLLWHPLDNYYHHSDKVKEILDTGEKGGKQGGKRQCYANYCTRSIKENT